MAGVDRWREMARRLAVVVMVLAASCVQAATIGFQYGYDDNGQLTTAADSTGTVVGYSYDPVGNLLAVSRTVLSSPSALALFSFTPQVATPGSTVSVRGQGFATSPAGNAVTINGVAATVTAATANALAVTVPANASTGPIQVTVGTSSVLSGSNLVILQVPTIAAITPAFALQGSAAITNFTVTGTNLSGATFSFAPAFVPLPITISSVVINSGGTSAAMTITPASTAAGSYTLVATGPAGASSAVPTAGNTFTLVSTDPNADSDGDGLTNVYEVARGANPIQPSSSGSGIPDGWAVYFGLDPTNPAAATSTAPDGLTWLQAYQAGLNPLIPGRAPPTVAQVYPANNATAYPTNGFVIVRFSEPLRVAPTAAAVQAALVAQLPNPATFPAASLTDATTVLSSFLQRTCCGGTVAPGVVQVLQNGRAIPGSVALSSDALSITFTPAAPLSSTTTYTVLVQGVRDAGGNLMAAPFQSSFTTAAGPDTTKPSVTAISPPSGSTGVPINAPVRLQFSKVMDPASLNASDLQLYGGITGALVPGVVQVDASGLTASFVPSAPLNVGDSYSFYVTAAGIHDASGNVLSAGTAWSFTTSYNADNAGPSTIGTSPPAGSTGVPTNAQVVLEFDRAVDWVSTTANIQLLQGTTVVPGAIALSDANRRVTLTPSSALLPNTAYTISVAAGLLDYAGVAVVNPGTSIFTTGASALTAGLQVTTLSPLSNSTGVPTNAVLQAQFSVPVDPITVNPTTFYLYPYADGNIHVPATLSVAADGLSATLTPTTPLQPSTAYYGYMYGVSNLAGSITSAATYFVTGTGTQSVPLAVTTASPFNGATGVPLNARVTLTLNGPVTPLSVSSATFTLSSAGGPVAGAVSLSADRQTLTFTPTAALSATTSYTVSLNGVIDVTGTPVTPYTGTFTAGSFSAGGGSLAVTVVTPSNGATAVSVATGVSITFSEPVNATSVVPASMFLYDQQTGAHLATSVAISAAGNVVTLTPVNPLPGGHVIIVYLTGVTDFAGNATSFSSSFTTATTLDTTPPQVVNVTPASGTNGVGLNASVVVTFSESVLPSTVNGNTLALFSNGTTRLSPSITMSSDNRTAVMSGITMPATTTITLVATPAITDVSGNALVPFSSQFTTTTALPTSLPGVTTMRPANGASGVSLGTNVVLFVSRPLNAATVNTGSVHVAQNGSLIAGTVTLSGAGQEIVFQPAAALQGNALIQVWMDATVQDTSGNPASAYYATFRTQVDASVTAPVVTAWSPAAYTSGIPLNPLFAIRYNVPLAPASVTTATVVLTTTGAIAPGIPLKLSLDATGTVIFAQPVDGSGTPTTLAPSTYYYLASTTGITSAAGLPQAANAQVYFYTGTATDTVNPLVTSVTPPNGSTGIGDNAQIVVRFSKAVDPASVNAATVSLKAGSTTVVESAITAATGNQMFTLQPQGVLPDNATLTLTVSGVVDASGNAVTPTTTSFTTGSGPDFGPLQVILNNPVASATSVPVNAAITIQTNKPIDPGSVNSSSFQVYSSTAGKYLTGTLSVASDGKSITFVPAAPLNVADSVSVYFANYGITDLSGNVFNGGISNWTFYTGTTQDTSGAQVMLVSPPNGYTGVPTNAQVEIGFDRPIDTLTVGQITLAAGGASVPVTTTFSNGDSAVLLTPTLLLQPSTTYTVTVTGVADVAGNLMSGTVTSNFTTTAGPQLNGVTILSVSPVNGATGVPVNATMQVQFSAPINPVTVNSGTVYLAPYYDTNIHVPGTISVAADGLSATFQPSSALLPFTAYYGYMSGMTDLLGNATGTSLSFTTSTAAQTSPLTVAGVSPVNTATGVPLNAVINVNLSAPVAPSTVHAGAVSLSTGGTAVPGTLSTSTDRMTLSFKPAAALSASASYSVAVAGFADVAGNAVTPFSSTFTTGTASATSLAVSSVVPSNGATAVAVSTTVQVTFSAPLNPATVVPSTMLLYQQSTGAHLAATLSLNAAGNVVTITPATPLPGGQVIVVYLSGVADYVGNVTSFSSSFTTAATVDSAGPTVTGVTPANGATSVGLNPTITINFSESVLPSSVNNNTYALFGANGVRVYPSASLSPDNRTLVLSGMNLPGSTTMTLVMSNGITDLSTNKLTAFSSQFTTAATLPTALPTVTVQRPANGASAVSTGTNVVLFVSRALNPSTVNTASVHMAQNGTIVSGTVSLAGGGQEIVFQPSAALQNNALVQVYVDNTVQDTFGNPLQAYSASFRTVVDPTVTAPTVVSWSPTAYSTGVPTNVVFAIGYSETLAPASVTTSTVVLTTTGAIAPGIPLKLSLDATGKVILAQPVDSGGNPVLLQPSTYYYLATTTGIQNASGLAQASNAQVYFQTGTAADTVVPTVLAVTPANGSTGIGDNAALVVRFSKAIDVDTVNASTISLTAGATQVVDYSFTFATGNAMVTIQPQGVLADNTTYTVKVNGVLDLAGNAVTALTSTFTTGTGPDFGPLQVVASNPAVNQTAVPLNAPISLMTNKAIDPASVTSSTLQIYDNSTGKYLSGTYSVSTDGKSISFVPTGGLTASQSYSVYFANYGITDLAGNQFNGGISNYSFTAGTAADTAAPQVVAVSPSSGFAAAPTNTRVLVGFDGPIDTLTAGQITLTTGSTVVPTAVTFAAGDAQVILTPLALLQPGTTYTINIGAVADLAGNLVTASTSGFTTAVQPQLVSPALVAVTPLNGATAVSRTVTPSMLLNVPYDAVTLNTTTLWVTPTANNTVSGHVAGTISLSADGLTATFTPAAPLAASTSYYFDLSGATDMVGNNLSTYISFTTGP